LISKRSSRPAVTAAADDAKGSARSHGYFMLGESDGLKGRCDAGATSSLSSTGNAQGT